MKNNVSNEPKKTLLKRRLKYGGLSVALTAVVIAVIIIANVIISTVMESNNAYLDLTNEGLYTLSEEAKEYIKQIKVPVSVKFVVPLDRIKSSPYLDLVYNTALEFSKYAKTDENIPEITVEYFDTYKYPARFEEYKTKTSAWYDTNVIIEAETTQTPRVCQLNEFFAYDTTTSTKKMTGYKGEQTFLLAFSEVAGVEKPIVAFTTGHGEPIGENPDDTSNKYYDFVTLFKDVGFEVQYVNLQKEELDPDCKLVVVLEPKNDFMSGNEFSVSDNSEIDKISSFIADNGSIMVFLAPGGSEFKNLSEFLQSWNLDVKTGYTIKDAENTLSADDTDFSVLKMESGLGTTVTTKYKNQRTRFKNAAPVVILKNNRTNTYTASLFKTSASALAYASDTDIINPKDVNGEDASGFDLFAVSTKTRQSNVDFEKRTSYVLVSGSPEMLLYCNSPAYANRGVLNMMISVLPLVSSPVDLNFKNLESNGVPSITAGDVRVWSIVLTAVIPAVVLVVGVVVIVRRKRY